MAGGPGYGHEADCGACRRPVPSGPGQDPVFLTHPSEYAHREKTYHPMDDTLFRNKSIIKREES